ncbi:hypothetical protein CAEBREN_24711 [Caenorhabditis brenneri]|uniref:Uncharacterized protein n=1 Tax=Caenorhabditis brenneri TaxID=135651 RepID=G0ND62_CAEBE|nr:hypothetical protein CAEBREN_24711 [Caenorhabditis brenneri]
MKEPEVNKEMDKNEKKEKDQKGKEEPESTSVETVLKEEKDCLKVAEGEKYSIGEQQESPKNDVSIPMKEVIARKDSVEKKEGDGPTSSSAASRSSGQVRRKRKHSPIDVYSVKPNAEGKYIFPWRMIEPDSDESSVEEEDDGVDEEHAYNYRDY